MPFLARTSAFLLFALATTVAEPINVSGKGFHGAAQPQLAVATNGTIHVVFGAGNAVFHSSSKDGRAFGTPVKIAELEKLALGKRRGPRLAVTDQAALSRRGPERRLSLMTPPKTPGPAGILTGNSKE